MVLNLFMNSSLGAIIASVKSLQIITHLSLMPIIVPANAQIFFGFIFTVVTFDPVDMQGPVEEYFDLKQADGVELADNFV